MNLTLNFSDYFSISIYSNKVLPAGFLPYFKTFDAITCKISYLPNSIGLMT